MLPLMSWCEMRQVLERQSSKVEEEISSRSISNQVYLFLHDCADNRANTHHRPRGEALLAAEVGVLLQGQLFTSSSPAELYQELDPNC